MKKIIQIIYKYFLKKLSAIFFHENIIIVNWNQHNSKLMEYFYSIYCHFIYSIMHNFISVFFLHECCFVKIYFHFFVNFHWNVCHIYDFLFIFVKNMGFVKCKYVLIKHWVCWKIQKNLYLWWINWKNLATI